MNIKATRMSAFFSGGFALSAYWFASKMMPYSSELNSMLFGIAAFFFVAIFFVVPVVFFVAGANNLRFRFSDIASPKYYVELGGGTIRIICWFLGVAFFGGISILISIVSKTI